jgi:hypothetical protein
MTRKNGGAMGAKATAAPVEEAAAVIRSVVAASAP